MDGYVTKPIDGVELTRIIDQLVPPAAAQGTIPAAAVPVAPVAAGRPAFDERFVRARLGDNARLFAKLVRLFLEDYPARMRAMRARHRRRRRRGAARGRARGGGCGKFRSRSGGRSRASTRASGQERGPL